MYSLYADIVICTEPDVNEAAGLVEAVIEESKSGEFCD